MRIIADWIAETTGRTAVFADLDNLRPAERNEAKRKWMKMKNVIPKRSHPEFIW